MNKIFTEIFETSEFSLQNQKYFYKSIQKKDIIHAVTLKHKKNLICKYQKPQLKSSDTSTFNFKLNVISNYYKFPVQSNFSL